ncbi:MAG: aspartate/glutamate racemase family protein [Candidatus Saccharibacteria bacterium]|nr:aspartate/glutamate racemase family protein [Candidatus Saccharibacteria bacterium]
MHVSLPIDDFISDRAKTTQALIQIVDALRQLDIQKSDQVVLACNTAHLMQAQIELLLGIKITSLIDAVMAKVSVDKLQNVGVLGSPTTIKSRLFHDVIEKQHLTVTAPKEEDLEPLEEIIRSVIANTVDAQTIDKANSLIDDLIRQGAEKIILGCTELSTLGLNRSDTIDPLDEITSVLLVANQGNNV